MTTFVKTEVRASEVARGCDRMSVGRALGWEAREHDEETLEWFSRGQLFEWYYGKQLDAKHGRENIVRQPSFQHPLGVGHSDFLIVPERLLVEVKSTQAGTLSTPVFDNGVEQLRIAIHFHPDADQGALVMLNPSTLRPADVFKVVNSEEDDERIAETFLRIAASIEAETLPERVCSKPGQARGMMCPFAASCFEGWEPEPMNEVDDPVVLAAAAELAAIVRSEREHGAAMKALDEAKRSAKAMLADVLPEKGESVVGPFLVRTWPVRGKVNVSAKALEAAGIDPYLFATVGAPRIEVRIDLADEAGDIDYGEAPF